MALPSSNDLLTMDWGLNGQPAVLVPSTPSIDLLTMDWGLNGQPIVTNPSVSGPANVAGFDGVTATNIQSFSGVSYTNLETLLGID